LHSIPPACTPPPSPLQDIFEAWCDDRRNTVILCDFAVQVGGPMGVCAVCEHVNPTCYNL